MSNILVTGATGHLGAAVVENLLKKTAASNIRILVRDAAKAAGFQARGIQVATGNFDDYASLLAAFKGVDKLYIVSTDDIPNRARQQANAVKAAAEAGVKHVVYTSFQRNNETAASPIAFVASSHLATEQALKQSGLTYTLLQHGLYAEVIPLFAGEQLLQTKTLYFPAGEGKTAFALRTDFAEAGANILLDESGRYDNQAIELAGAEAITWAQIAQIISEITGKAIIYHSPSETEFTAALTQAGVPAEIIGMSVGFGKAISEGEFENAAPDLEEILGRKPVTVAEYLKTVYCH